MTRLWLICLVLAVVTGCSKPEPLEFSTLQGPLLTKWEGEMKKTVVYASSDLPSEGGLWIDNGLGWQGPFDAFRPAPFYAPKFRLYVGRISRSVWWNLPTTPVAFTATSGLSQSVVDSVGSARLINADKVGRLIQIQINQRTADVLYWMERADSLACVYVDPLAILRWHDDPVNDRTIRMLNKRGKEFCYALQTENGQWSLGAERFGVPLPSHFSVEFRGVSKMPYYYHWTMLLDYQPKVGILVSAGLPGDPMKLLENGTVTVRQIPSNPYITRADIDLNLGVENPSNEALELRNGIYMFF